MVVDKKGHIQGESINKSKKPCAAATIAVKKLANPLVCQRPADESPDSLVRVFGVARRRDDRSEEISSSLDLVCEFVVRNALSANVLFFTVSVYWKTVQQSVQGVIFCGF